MSVDKKSSEIGVKIIESASEHTKISESAVRQEEREGTASFASTSLNLLKSIIGAGILGIPLALKRLGYVPGLFTMFLAAVLSGFGLYLLSVIIEKSERNSTFSSAAKKFY